MNSTNEYLKNGLVLSQIIRKQYDYVMSILVLVGGISLYRFTSYLLGTTSFHTISEIRLVGLQSSMVIPAPIFFYFGVLPGIILFLIYSVYRESDKLGLLKRWTRCIFHILVVWGIFFFWWVILLNLIFASIFGSLVPMFATFANYLLIIFWVCYIVYLRRKLSQQNKRSEISK